MRTLSPQRRFVVAVALAVLVTACQQSDQALPFEPAPGEGVTVTVGAQGGTVAVPPSFSLDVPAGALSGSLTVSVVPRVGAPFPGDAGTPVPGTAFDIGPTGTALAAPARVEIAVPPELLEVGEDVRLALALIRDDDSVVTFQGAYDVTNGVLVADIDELGPVAAVVSSDAIAVTLGAPTPLTGGSMSPPGAPPAPTGPAPSSHGGVEFTASCAPNARRCFSSGVIRLWADDVVRSRMGDDIFLLAPEVDAGLDFISFDQNGLPTELVGSISVNGQLRARLNSTVTRRIIDDGVTTGISSSPTPTSLNISGNVLVVSETTSKDGSVEFNEELEYAVTGIGTSEMLVVQIEAEIDFENQDGSFTTGILTVHLRLRR